MEKRKTYVWGREVELILCTRDTCIRDVEMTIGDLSLPSLRGLPMAGSFFRDALYLFMRKKDFLFIVKGSHQDELRVQLRKLYPDLSLPPNWWTRSIDGTMWRPRS